MTAAAPSERAQALNNVTVALVRELCGFVWALLRQVPVPPA